MPLTMQLYGSSPESHGQIIIDRKNIIFCYQDDGTPIGQVLAAERRDRIADEMDNCLKNNSELRHLLSKAKSFATTTDPRHDALEHMSSYDRHTMHYHLIFQDDVNMHHISHLFWNLLINNIEDLISEECVQSILSISEQYFSHQIDYPSAKKIEEDYRQDKEIEFKKATEKAAKYDDSDDDSNDDTNDNVDDNKSLAIQTLLLKFPFIFDYDPLLPIILMKLAAANPTQQMGMPILFFNSTPRNPLPRIVAPSNNGNKKTQKSDEPTVFFFHQSQAKDEMKATREEATRRTLAAVKRAKTTGKF